MSGRTGGKKLFQLAYTSADNNDVNACVETQEVWGFLGMPTMPENVSTFAFKKFSVSNHFSALLAGITRPRTTRASGTPH